MSVAIQMGLDQVGGEALARVEQWWSGAKHDPLLGSVSEVRALPAWTRTVSRSQSDTVLARLAVRAAVEVEAATLLAWLLLPGAARIANCLHDLSSQVDGLVAGQLWIEVRTHGGMPEHAVAFTILQRVKWAVQADLGVGEGARRRDRTWVATILTDRIEECGVPVAVEQHDAETEVTSLFTSMLNGRVLTADEVVVLMSAALTANDLATPLRGRAGMTSPDALEGLTWLKPSGARSMRRRVGELLDRVATYSRDHASLDDTGALRRAREMVWTPFEVAMASRDPAMQRRLERFYAVLEQPSVLGPSWF